MTISVPKYILTLSLLVFGATAFAQDKKDEKKQQEPSKGGIAEEIEVVRPYKPVLADAVKIRRNPDLTDNRTFKPELTYTILDKRLELNNRIQELQVQKLPDEPEAVLKNNYLKIGAGNLNTGLGELYVNNGGDEALQVGLFAKYLSQKGSLNKQQLSNQQVAAFGRSIGDEVTLAGKLTYDRRSTYFYGYNPTFPVPAVDPDKQRFNTFDFEGELMKNYTDQSNQFNYGLKTGGYLFSNIAGAHENSIALSGYLSRPLNKYSVGINTSIDATIIKDISFDTRNHIFKVNPYVKYQNTRFMLNLGFNVVKEFGYNNRLNILPAVFTEIPIVAQYAILFGGISGDVTKTTLKSLTYENPYLSNNISIRNYVEKLNFYGGLKGNAGPGFGFKAMAYYKTVEDIPLFINNSMQISHFDVAYSNVDGKILGIEGEMSIKLSDMLDINSKAQLNNYKLAGGEEAWLKPAFRLSTMADAKINDKFKVNAELLFNGETKARTYIFTPLPEPQITHVASYIDLSVAAEYQINNKIGVYLRANNIFGDTYQQYLYYPKVGLNVLAGFNFSF